MKLYYLLLHIILEIKWRSSSFKIYWDVSNLNNTMRMIVKALGGASLYSLSVAWVSLWGLSLSFTTRLCSLVARGCLNPYTPTSVFEGVQFNAYHKRFVFNWIRSINCEHFFRVESNNCWSLILNRFKQIWYQSWRITSANSIISSKQYIL